MRLVLDPRARRWLRRLPRYNPYSVVEQVLLALLAVQCARLLWAVVTPVGPVGDWRPAPPAATPDSIFRSFDPFFRGGAGGGQMVVTSLDLKLFGIRSDQASGRGSAIIATPDGRQQSYAVGEEILPGVTLDAVAFDNVTILRGGTREQIFLDQSQPATTLSPISDNASPPSVGTPVAAPPLPAAAADLQFTPRMKEGTVTGFIVDPTGVGQAFRSFGFQPGDVVLAVNGVPASNANPETIRAALAQSGGQVTAEIERNGNRMTLSGTYTK